MTYDDFAESFLAAIYLETEGSGQQFHKAEDIIRKYDLEVRTHWIRRMADEWEGRYFGKIIKVLEGYEAWAFQISADGSRKVESEFKDEHEIREFLLPGESIASDIEVTATAEAKHVPASDRLVPLNHNSHQYSEISEGLRNVIETARSTNDFGETAAERTRLLHSLDAANDLWAALELKVIQIKVGIILALEDAADAFKKIGKKVAIDLLVDMIKALVKAAVDIVL